MEKVITPIGLLRAWAEIPTTIENAIDGLDEALDLGGGSSGMSVREIVLTWRRQTWSQRAS